MGIYRERCLICGKWNGAKRIYCTEKHRIIGLKIRNALVKYSGDKNWNWKGGISIGENRKKYRHIKDTERRASIKGSKGSFTVKQWENLKKEKNYTCLNCLKKEPEIKLTIDHKIPVSKGGSNFIENIQPLCLSCNCRKNNKLDFIP